MTEAEWLSCIDVGSYGDTGKMHDFLTGKGSPRKLRLFACHCCRRVESLLTDARSLQGIEAAERYADGLADLGELEAASRLADQAADEIDEREGSTDPPELYAVALAVAFSAAPNDGEDTVHLASHAAFYSLRAVDTPDERRYQAQVLVDVLGGPSVPPAFSDTWRTSAVVGLADAIYAGRLFDRLPVLADALEEAGCDHPDVLAHCRGPGPHVRGCWVVDLILGKS